MLYLQTAVHQKLSIGKHLIFKFFFAANIEKKQNNGRENEIL